MRIVRWTGRTMARVCSWCREPMSEQDAEAIRKNPDVARTHTICPACKAAHFPELDEAETEPAA